MRHTKKLITLAGIAGIAAFATYWFYLPPEKTIANGQTKLDRVINAS